MNKPLLVILVTTISLIIGSFVYLLTQEQEPTNTNGQTTKQAGIKPEPTEPPATGQAIGSYTEYSDEKVTATSGTKILFFHAPWCPQCRTLETSIETGPIPEGVTIFKVDYDSNQELRQRYGVTIQTTLVRIDDNGNLVEKYVAYSEPTLNSVSENLLR